MRKPAALIAANFLLFQAGWFVCAVAVAAGRENYSVLASSLLLFLHFCLSRERRRDMLIVLCTGLIGGTLDSALGCVSVLVFHGGGMIAPLWLWLLWMLFATTIHYSLWWMRSSVPLQAIAGAAGGALSYYAGAGFGALQLGTPVGQSVLTIALLWAVLLPLLYRMARLFDHLPPPSAWGKRHVTANENDLH